jgi:RNA polymerase primary sigma factor
MANCTDGLKTYFDEVSDHRLLTRDEEVELFRRMEQGDESAREEIIRCNLRFVIRMANQFQGRGLPLEDLIQEGNIGLIEVTGRFDYRRGFRFSTYAAFWIRQAMQQALRKQGNMIRLPVRKSRMLGQMNEVVSRHQNEWGRNPSLAELAEAMETTEENMTRLLKMREPVLSLDEPNKDGFTLGEALPSDSAASPVERAVEGERKVRVKHILTYLTEREERVVRLRFGFENGKSMSLRRASRLVGLSQEGVRRIEQKALAKLRRPAISAKVAQLL